MKDHAGDDGGEKRGALSLQQIPEGLRCDLAIALYRTARLLTAGVSAEGDVVLELQEAGAPEPAHLRLTQRGRGRGGHLLFTTTAGDVRTDARTREAAMLAAAAWRAHGRALAPVMARVFPHLLLDADELTAQQVTRLDALDWTGTPLWGRSPSALLRPAAGVLDPMDLGDRLCAVLAPGARLAGYRLHTITWPRPAHRAAPTRSACLLTFVRDAGPKPVCTADDDRRDDDLGSEDRAQHLGEILVLRACVDPSTRPRAFAFAGAFAVLASESRAHPPDGEALAVASWLTLALALVAPRCASALPPRSLLDSASVNWPSEHPMPLHNLRPRRDGERVLHFSIDAECHQACAFCTVKQQGGVHDGGEDELEGWHLQLRTARSRGCSTVQLNGVDPLAHSRILALCDDARRLGFEELHLMGPGRRLHDRAFLAELLAAAPPRLRVTLPLYGTSAHTHERVTGAPGSFDQAMAALDALHDALPRGALQLATVMTRHNVHELAGLWALSRRLDAPFYVQPVYPLPNAPPEVFAENAAPAQDLAHALLTLLAEEGERGAEHHAFQSLIHHPCVLIHAARSSGLPVPWSIVRRPRPDLLANAALGYSVLPLVPCDHASACAVSEYCPKVHFQAYARAFSLAAFAAVEGADAVEP